LSSVLEKSARAENEDEASNHGFSATLSAESAGDAIKKVTTAIPTNLLININLTRKS
jgi:hypothetical protein